MADELEIEYNEMMRNNEAYPPHRTEDIEIREPEILDVGSMVAVYVEAFRFGNLRLRRAMHGEGLDLAHLDFVVEDILKTRLDSQDSKFMVACRERTAQDYELDVLFEHDSLDPEPASDYITWGWISVSFITHNCDFFDYEASDFTTYACLELLADQARERGENPPSMSEPRVALLHELLTRSKDGQARHMTYPHLVVNTLISDVECHQDTHWEIAFKLLNWAISYAERRHLAIWTQVPVNQIRFFRQVGFREARAFSMNLNNCAPRGSARDWGTQEWVQMVYHVPEERRTRSASPRDGGGRQRRSSR